VKAGLDRDSAAVHITVHGPEDDPPTDVPGIAACGADFWTLAVTRELDDLVLDLRTNELRLGTWLIRTLGDPRRVLAYDELLGANSGDWLVREIVLYAKRTLKRLDVTSRSLFALIEPGSCFAGTLLELALAADRTFQLDGVFEDAGPAAEPATVTIGAMNLGPLPMANGLTRLRTRFCDDEPAYEAAVSRSATPLPAADALALGLVTFAPDDLDWEDEVRLAVEERASFSPDALTGLEANFRFPGPETLETKIFGRLSAWQNWIFTRPNAAGPDGALRKFGTGQRPEFDRKRV
jgi:benzoyl-CoA-dihydrodiol lyase